MLEAARLTGAVELVLTGCRPRCGGAPTAWLLLVVVRATSVASARRGAVVLAAPGAALSFCVFASVLLAARFYQAPRVREKSIIGACDLLKILAV